LLSSASEQDSSKFFSKKGGKIFDFSALLVSHFLPFATSIPFFLFPIYANLEL